MCRKWDDVVREETHAIFRPQGSAGSFAGTPGDPSWQIRSWPRKNQIGGEEIGDWPKLASDLRHDAVDLGF